MTQVAANGRRHRGTGRVDCLLPEATWHAFAFQFDLTERELEVARGLFAGVTEPELADDLGISRHTTHTYVSRIYRKAQVRNRAELLLQVFIQHLGRGSERNGREPRRF